MKTITIFLIISLNIFAQDKIFNKELELQKFIERGGKVEEISANVYKLTYVDGTQRVFNFNPSRTKNDYPEGFDTTIINVWEIDTTLYAHKFRFWQRVDFTANSAAEPAPIDDINNNGLLEYYGPIRISQPFEEPVDIWEQNNQLMFQKVFTYNSATIAVLGIGDVNSDGTKDVYLRTRDTLNGKFYKADSLGAFPTTFDFTFYYYTTAQINHITFGDFDSNGITDCAFQDGSIFIATYDSSINNFYEVEQFNLNDDAAGFAINDFDDDGKTELVISTGMQVVYVIEAEHTNLYSFVWSGPAPSVNPWMITSTNDIDGNDKNEFWIGGMDFTTGISTFWCYEADGDNSYIPVTGIELRYLVAFTSFCLQAIDMDYDGVEDLVINIGNHLLILKFKGNPNQHNYSLFYAKIGEVTQPGGEFLPSTINDFNADGKNDLLLSFRIHPPPHTSYILIQDTVTSVANYDLQMPGNFSLSQNYPNPFNPSTQLKVGVHQQCDIKVSVYNILGKKIKLLLNENLPAGEYTVQWDGNDNEGNHLTSGIYFIQMIAGSYQKTIKTVLLK